MWIFANERPVASGAIKTAGLAAYDLSRLRIGEPRARSGQRALEKRAFDIKALREKRP